MKTNSANRMSDMSIQSSERRGRPLARLAELFGRRTTPSYRMAPPLRNPHYVGLHIAVASSRSWTR
jgi:hypothetical protein